MTKKLTLLFTPIPAVGHVNASIGLAECLRDRGHRIVIVVEKSFEGQLISYGFEEEILECEEVVDKKPGEDLAEKLFQSGVLSNMSSIEKVKKRSNANTFLEIMKKKKRNEPQIEAIVNKYNPDVILIDDVIGSPAVIYANIPWVLLVSLNPLYMIQDDRTPPCGSGYPTIGDKSPWKEFFQVKNESNSKARDLYDKWMTQLGLPISNKENIYFMPDSPYLNIYGFPQELDYTDIRPNPEKWFRIDTFARKGEQEFKLPEKLKRLDENGNEVKLIYLSMGSMGSIDIKLMKRLVEILSKSPHNYIVSKGLYGDKYELADNMWGANSVPQTKVLPLVDLVITHGGNNTVTEAFSFGKPMIVMPLFSDQYDNAQRVQEKEFGLRLEPYDCTEQELLEAIEKLLNDNNLKNRLKAASKRIVNYQSLVKASELIEKLV